MPVTPDPVPSRQGGSLPRTLDARAAGRSLRQRIVVLGVVLIMAIDAGAVYDIWRARQRKLEDADREIGNTASVLAEHTASAFQQIDLVLRDTATWVLRIDPRVTDGRAVHDHLKQQIASVPQILLLNISDETGRQMHTSRTFPPLPFSSSDRPFFIAQRDNPEQAFYISEPARNRVDGEWGIGISRRLSGADGRFRGIVVSIADVKYFVRFYESLKLGPRNVVALFRSDGVLLARHPSGEALYGRISQNLPGLLAAQPRSGGHVISRKSPHDDSGKIMGLRAVPGFPLAIMVARDERTVLSGWVDHAVMIGVITLSWSLLGALMIAWLVRKLVQLEAADEEKQKLEIQLRQAHKMEAMGTLAGGIAHDFNNILGAILGFGEMAQSAAPEGSALRRYLEHILAAGNRAKALVARILAFSRSVMGERTQVHLQDTVREAMELLHAALPSTITLQLNLHPEDATVISDATELHQLVMNLCTNAAQAMPDGGTLTVGLDVVEIGADKLLSHGAVKAGSYVRLTVADTGYGMDRGTLGRIFDPFFTTKQVGNGTGLGLSVVHGIVSELGGGINVESRPGAGSRFEIYLPRAAAAAAAEAEMSQKPPHGNGETLMLVDDEQALVLLNEELLAGLGYEPVGFTSSTQALAEFRADPARFDLVLTDETMPGMTGIEFASELRSLRPDIPIILMSGYTTLAVARKAQAAGVREVLGKPLQAAKLAAAVARALRATAGSSAA